MRLTISKDSATLAQHYVEQCQWLSQLGLIRLALAVGILKNIRRPRPQNTRLAKLPFTYETLDPGRVFAVTLTGNDTALKTQKMVCARIEEHIEGGLEELFRCFPEPGALTFSRLVTETTADIR